MSDTTNVTGWSTRAVPNPEPGVPWLLRKLGARWRDGKRLYRMSWGEMSLLRPGFGLELHLFGDPTHYSLQVHLPWLLSAYIRLPFMQRWARDSDHRQPAAPTPRQPGAEP